MKRIIFGSALLLILLGATSLAPTTKIKYSSVEAKLTVTFPAEFSTTEQVEESYKSIKTQALLDGMVFFVIYTIHENDMTDPEGLAKISLDAFSGGLESTITEESAWKVNKKNGLQALLEVPEKELVGEYRVVILDQIQYQITVVSPKSDWDEKKAKKFFKSFKVSKK